MRDLGKWRTLFLLGGALAIGGLWSQGRLEIFLHPRYAALLPWSALVLLVLGLVELAGWGRGASGEAVKFRHAIWLLPFAAGLALRPDGFSGNFAASRGLTAAGRMLAEAGIASSGPAFPDEDLLSVDSGAAGIDTLPPEPAGEAPRTASSTKLAAPTPPTAPAGILPPPAPPDSLGKPRPKSSLWCDLPAPKGSTCVDTVRERYWYEQMLAFYMEPARHRGRRVRMVGRLQRDEAVEPGGWHVGRMMIWCCAADASPLGLYLVGSTEGPLPSEGGWVAVEGVLDVRRAQLPGMSRVRDVPVLREATATPADAPPQENVFPFSY